MIKLDKGVKETKLATVVVNIYFNPLKLNNDSTDTKLSVYSKVTSFAILL